MDHAGQRGALALTAAALLLTSCNTPTPGTPTGPAPASTPATTMTKGAPPVQIATFGDTVTYPDGLTLTVSAPGRFTPSSSAVTMSKASTFVRFQITVTNGTSTVVQTDTLTRSMQSGGTDISMDDVYDGTAGSWPDSPVLPGKHLTWVKGWGVPDPTNLQLAITLSGHPEAIFTTH